MSSSDKASVKVQLFLGKPLKVCKKALYFSALYILYFNTCLRNVLKADHVMACSLQV